MMEEHEVHGIVFVGFMLTVLSCTMMILYVRTSCYMNPIALREFLKARRDIVNRQPGSMVMEYDTPFEQRNYLRRNIGGFRVKRITTQYEVEQEDNKQDIS